MCIVNNCNKVPHKKIKKSFKFECFFEAKHPYHFCNFGINKPAISSSLSVISTDLSILPVSNRLKFENQNLNQFMAFTKFVETDDHRFVSHMDIVILDNISESMMSVRTKVWQRSQTKRPGRQAKAEEGGSEE
jgi:hypothetical protein